MADLLLTPNRNGSASPPKLLGPDGKELASDTGIPLAHYANFAAIWNQFNQTYSYTYDEAIRDSWTNTLSMRRDAFIWGCLDERYRAVTQSPWHIDYPDKDDEGQRAVAGELEKLIKAIPRFSLVLRNLEDAVWYGRYGVQLATGPCEANGVPQTGIVHTVPVNGDKIQVGWDGIPRVMISSTVQNDYQQRGWKVVVGQQSPMVILDKPELRERFVINQFERDDADYFEGEMAGMVGGVGVRSRIYWAWWMRQEMLGWAVNYMRKVGTLGLLVFPFAEGNADSEAAAQENIKQAGNRSSLMVPVPAGGDPKQVAPFVISPSNAGIDSLTSMIDSYWERHIERYIVGQNMSDGSESGNSLGGTGRAEFAASSKYDKVKGDCDVLAETLTVDLLKPLHRWNYAGQQFVYSFKFGVKDPQADDKLESGIKLAALVEIKADELREAGGFSKPQPGDEIAGGGMDAAPHGLGLDGKPLDTPFEPGPFGGDKSETPAADEESGVENFARYSFVESEHPRGQPENDGQFTKKPGGKAKRSKPQTVAEAKAEWAKHLQEVAAKNAAEPTRKATDTIASQREQKEEQTRREVEEFHAAKDYKANGTRAAAFKAWFGDWESDPANASKVVNESGEPQETHGPIKLYHGSRKKFEQFDKQTIGSATDPGNYGSGFYFSDSPTIGRLYAMQGGKVVGQIVEAYLSIRNPLVIENKNGNADPSLVSILKTLANPVLVDHALSSGTPVYDIIQRTIGSDVFTAHLKSLGYDGVIQGDDRSTDKQYVAFEPTQIKAVENAGTFDPKNPSIRYQRIDEMHSLQLEVAELRGFTRAQTNYQREEPATVPPSIVVNVPPIQFPDSVRVDQPAPIVNVDVHVPEQKPIIIPPAEVTVNVPQQAAPLVNFTVPQQAAPVVKFIIPEQPAPVVNISIPEAAEYEETSVIERNEIGLISKIRKLFRRK